MIDLIRLFGKKKILHLENFEIFIKVKKKKNTVHKIPKIKVENFELEKFNETPEKHLTPISTLPVINRRGGTSYTSVDGGDAAQDLRGSHGNSTSFKSLYVNSC